MALAGIGTNAGLGIARWRSPDLPAPTMTMTLASWGGAGWMLLDEQTDVTEPGTQGKPPYRVPTMAEVAAVTPNGYNVVSLFSGAGGSCCGLRMAGYKVLWASEFVPAARDTYRANWPDTILDERDIREVKPGDILRATGLKRGQLDVLEGSPPCASFSTAGKRNKTWGKVKSYSDTQQRSDDLFFEYARILEGLQPRVFTAENVSGLVKGVAKGYFLEILARLKACGYTVQARLLDAQWLGVPQMRQRIFFVGVREDLGLAPAFPDPLPYRYSVREALPATLDGQRGVGFRWNHDGQPHPGDGHGMLPADQPMPTVMHGSAVDAIVAITGRTGPHEVRAPSEIDASMNIIGADDPAQTRYEISALVGGPGAPFDGKQARYDVDKPLPTDDGGQGARGSHAVYVEEADISRYAIGREWDKLKPGEQSEKYFQLVKPDPASPWDTVTQRGGDNTVASVTHPTERRKFTIAELRAICSFPPDYQLTGSYAQQWERCGRAVPPLMMFHLATAIREQVLDALSAVS